MAGMIKSVLRVTKRDSKKDKKDDIIVFAPDHTDHTGSVRFDENGQMSIEGTIPEAFQNQIAAIFKERKEGKFLPCPPSPVETRKKSEKGPTVTKGLSTAEILAMMRELCLPGNPWDVYTYVRVCFSLYPAWVSQYLLHSKPVDFTWYLISNKL